MNSPVMERSVLGVCIMNKWSKQILILLALVAGGGGFYVALSLKPLTGKLVFWQHALRQHIAQITDFAPRSLGAGAPLTWVEQWQATWDQMAPWVLAYQLPAQHHLGRLRFYQEDLALSAENRNPHAKTVYELNDVAEFAWHLGGDLTGEDGKFKAPFYLELVIKQQTRPAEIVRIDLPNLSGIRDEYGQLSGDLKFNHLQNSSRTGAIEGLQTFSPQLLSMLQVFNQEHLDLAAMISNEDHLVLCQKVDDQCQVIGKSTCAQCRYGYFPVVGNKFCPETGTYACGPNFCGEANWPACWRGFVANEEEANDHCFDESKAGYCHHGLRTMCRDGILYCW